LIFDLRSDSNLQISNLKSQISNLNFSFPVRYLEFLADLNCRATCDRREVGLFCSVHSIMGSIQV
jgi:hypothetical protein